MEKIFAATPSKICHKIGFRKIVSKQMLNLRTCHKYENVVVAYAQNTDNCPLIIFKVLDKLFSISAKWIFLYEHFTVRFTYLKRCGWCSKAIRYPAIRCQAKFILKLEIFKIYYLSCLVIQMTLSWTHHLKLLSTNLRKINFLLNKTKHLFSV